MNNTPDQYHEQIQVRVTDASGRLPRYATPDSAGMDVHAFLKSPLTIAPGGRALVPTGLRVQLPHGFEMQVRPRSGLALRHGITLLNAPGTIDADYRGEIGIILANMGSEPFTVNDGDRIAQLVLARCYTVQWLPSESLDDTARGDGGFGHSGI